MDLSQHTYRGQYCFSYFLWQHFQWIYGQMKRKTIVFGKTNIQTDYRYPVNTITMEGCVIMPAKRTYTIQDPEKLPSFLRVEMLDGILYTDDWTDLEIDEEVFQNPPSENNHVTYRLSVVRNV